MANSLNPALNGATPRAVLFDAYGTLFDVYSVAQLAEQLFPGHGQALSLLWRDKQIEYTRLVTTSRRYGQLGSPDSSPPFYRPFGELTRAALVYAIKRIANNDHLTLDKADFDAKVDRLMAQYRQLDAFADAREVLAALKARGIPTGILSNGDPDMLGAVVRHAGLAELLDHVISVDRVRHYKTHPEAYALGVHAIGAAAGENRLRQQQQLGRAGRHLVRLHHAVGEPRRPAVRGARHPTHPHGRVAGATCLIFSRPDDASDFFLSILPEVSHHDRTHPSAPPASRHRAAPLH